MIQFLKCYAEAEDTESKQVKDKIEELNAVWIAYCEKLGKVVVPAAKDEFMNHVNKAIAEIKLKINKADDTK